MASNPQLPVEDQTDEDFFDKLVDDDFPGTESGSELAAADESDETKAFPSLSLGEVETRVDDWRGETKEEEEFGGSNVELVGHSAEGSNSLVPPNSTGIDDLIEPKNDVTNGIPDSTTDRGESLSSGVKEVQWSLFNTDATRSGGSGGFGSYSDLFNELEDTSRGFPEKAEENLTSETKMVSGSEGPKTGVMMTNSSNYEQYQGGQGYVADVHSIASVQDSSSNQYWENLYPGWKYDPNTGQWYQVDGFDSMKNVQDNFDANSAGTWAASDGKLEASYLQQTVQSVAGTVTDSSATGNVSSWNQVSQVSNDYPEHMVFDPQYPGWYYDTIAQEWRTLDAYNLSLLQAVQSEDQLSQNGFDSAGFYSQDHDHRMYGECGQANNDGSQGHGTQHRDDSWSGSYTDYSLQTFNGWQPEKVHDRPAVPEFSRNQQVDSPYVSNVSVNCLVDQKRSFNSVGMNQLYDKTGWGNDNAGGNARSQSCIPGGGITQQYNQPKAEQNEQVHFSNNYYDSQKSGNHSQQPLHNSHQFSYTSDAGRSSAGRPPHALVTFGFGGKIILMKDSGSSRNASYGNQDPAGGSVSVLNLMEAVTEKMDAPSGGVGPCNYFRSLCQQSFPGPLVGGNVGSKELNKWIDERVANCESPGMDYRKGEVLRLLLSLLKISCQHYGKLRSPFGTDTTSRESENPESAVAKLFASANRHGGQFNAHGAIAHCLQNFPSGHIQATAAEVQSLLVSGRTKEALLCAQEGQLWGPALVLAAQLGDRFYVDTVKQMALHQLTAGSPLRTLCLLIAGQHADVFSTDATTTKAYPSAANRPQQSGQLGGNVMLDDWEKNLAVITANRTKDDELVIIHLGDCLWKERSEIVAAHICYLIAEANFEPYSDSARLCLIGADHWKFPRTFSNPEAIQRTELYEYSKALGNSQFTLLPFQPYKLIYAHMLAEVGKVPDALKYCQAVLKSIKTSRAPEVETLKQSVLSLEERLKTHQQGGFTTNLAPAKLVGKLLNLFDSTAHRVVGGLPPVPPTSQSSVHGNGHFPQMMGPRVSASQSTMAMSSLMPSESMEPTSEWTADGSQKPRHNRSVSEPDFSRTPRQGDSPKGAASDAQGNKASNSSRSSRFARFGFGSQFLQKTVGLVLKRSDRQAKLGEKNKFYYDEKLKRWVEEGAEPPADEAALPPPPTTSAFQNGMSDYSLRKALKSEGSPTDRSPDSTKRNPMESSSGIPPIPPSSNQFSARGRAGVRSRYVDTFNQNTETSGSLFQSPSVPSLKSAGPANPKFFVPKPASSSAIETVNSIEENALESASTNESPSTSTINRSSHFSPPSSSMPMQRIPSMGTINGDVSVPPHSRRTASWSGSFPNALSPPKKEDLKPLGEALGMPPSAFMPNNPPLMNGSNLGDELHEVEL